jgi:hypothetical protein
MTEINFQKNYRQTGWSWTLFILKGGEILIITKNDLLSLIYFQNLIREKRYRQSG